MTPAYLAKIGLVPGSAESRQAEINAQMKLALQKIAFLPFGKVIDEWRWKVFSGEITPDQYNAAWWALRERYQGVAPPVARSELDFDPGAKYHVPGNTPYTRYFAVDARVLDRDRLRRAEERDLEGARGDHGALEREVELAGAR